jgi:hypothetical protein
MNSRLRLAAALIIVGLAIQLVSLVWNTPLSFLAFIFAGSPFVFAGILVYLVSTVILSEKK